MNKILKRTLQGIVGAAIISGTYFGRGKNDFPPLYSHKTHDSYGINVAFVTDIDSGASINGANVSVFTSNYGKINGLNLVFAEHNSSDINGANISVGNIEDNGCTNGLELSLFNCTFELDDDLEQHGSTLNGLAIGLFNVHRELNGAQIGVYNRAKDNAGVILNVDYQKKK